MALTKREKYIGMGVGAAVLLFVLDQVVFSPYLDALAKIDDQTNTAIAQQKQNDTLFLRQTSLKKDWDDITSNIKYDDSTAESQALEKALTYADSAGVNTTAVKPERSIEVKQFVVTPFLITATGSTPAIARLLTSFENATIPLRVDEMTLTPVKEGTDNLKIELTLSTLSSKPGTEPGKTAGTNAGPASEAK